MIWFTWRQFRTQAWTAVGALTALALLLVITAHSLTNLYNASGIAGCQANCATLIANFLQDAQNAYTGHIYNIGGAAVYLVPALIGLFWGAPLIARELETGTHRLAWNQSITRTRWLVTKLGLIGLAGMVTAGVISLAVSWWASDVDSAAADRITPLVFGGRGIVPIGYAAFAFTLGATAGMLIRRTVPAMAATLVAYVAVVAVMPLWLRAHLLPSTRTSTALDLSGHFSVRMHPPDGVMAVLSDSAPAGAWVLSNQTVTPSGQVFVGPADPQYCGIEHGPQSCNQWLTTLGLRQDLSYQPASHFWPLQWAETGIFLALAVALAGFCFWWTRRRLT